MQMIKVSELKPHPRNIEFFDDITGDKWEDFKKSIVRRGVVEGIVVTQDLIIVSGHQRVRACKELDIVEVPCRVTHYPESDPQTNNPKEDMILEDLISTNILQRGIGNVNPMKMARCIVELEKIYGIRQGSAGKSDKDNLGGKSQKELASDIGVTDQQLRDYKKLNMLIPELQEMVEDNELKATTAYKLWAKMPQNEQEKFFNEIGKEEISKMTQKQTQEYLQLQEELNAIKEKMKEQSEHIEEVVEEKLKIANQENENNLNSIKLELEKERRDNQTLEHKLIQLEANKAIYEEKIRKIEEESRSEQAEIEKLRKQKEKLELQAHISISDLQIKIHNFIDNASPSVFLQGAVASSAGIIKDDLLDSVVALEDFTRTLREILDAKIEPNRENVIEIN